MSFSKQETFDNLYEACCLFRDNHRVDKVEIGGAMFVRDEWERRGVPLASLVDWQSWRNQEVSSFTIKGNTFTIKYTNGQESIGHGISEVVRCSEDRRRFACASIIRGEPTAERPRNLPELTVQGGKLWIQNGVLHLWSRDATEDSDGIQKFDKQASADIAHFIIKTQGLMS